MVEEIFQRCAECRAYLRELDTHETLCRWCEYMDVLKKAEVRL